MELKDFIKKTVISVGLVVLTGIVPIFGIIPLFISVVPQIVMLQHSKYFSALFSWSIVSISVGLIFGWGFLPTYIFLFPVYGIAYTLILKFDMNQYKKILNCSLFWVFLFSVWFLFNYTVFNINLFEKFIGSIKATGALSIGKYYDLDMSYKQIEIINTAMRKTIDVFKTGFVGWSMIGAVLGSGIIYYILSLQGKIRPMPRIEDFRLSETLVWVLIAAGLFYMAGRNFGKYNLFFLIGSSTGIVLLGGYFLSGLGAILYFLTKWNVSVFMKFFILFVLFVFLKGMYLFIILGIVDVWINFRKRFSRTKG
ncbi:MAG: DUF2232 domain-containing protein [Elusimicrobiota bacterium]